MFHRASFSVLGRSLRAMALKNFVNRNCPYSVSFINDSFSIDLKEMIFHFDLHEKLQIHSIHISQWKILYYTRDKQ